MPLDLACSHLWVDSDICAVLSMSVVLYSDIHCAQSWEEKPVRLVTGDIAMTRHRTKYLCARLCVLFTCRIGIFLKKCSCTMWLKLIRPHGIGQQQSLNNHWANHFTSAERRWWDPVILALVWSVCSAAPVFRCNNYIHTCPHVAVSLFPVSFWALISFGFVPPPHLHPHIQHISATLSLSQGIREDTCRVCVLHILYFYTYVISVPMHENAALFCVCFPPSQTTVWHLCPFWNQLFFRASHLKPRTAFLFLSLWHLMSKCYALVCRLLLNNPTRVNALKSCYSL